MPIHSKAPEGPNFAAGIGIEAIDDGMILRGHVDGEPALAIRRGNLWRIVGANCSHYGLPLEEGLVVGEELRCPFHHARFCLKTGAALGAPALDPIASWDVTLDGPIARAGARRLPPASDNIAPSDGGVRRVVIVGSGAAGHAAAEMLRAEGYGGTITMLGADRDLPYDRPKCSKALLSGEAEEKDVFWRDTDDFRRQRIDLHTGTVVTAIDRAANDVVTATGERFAYDALLLATGAQPRRLDVPGADLPHVHYLRSLDDARGLIAAASAASPHPPRVVVIGASFIGLEVTAALRTRGLPVSVVSPGALPLEKRLGQALSDALRDTHEQHGVVFHIGAEVASVDRDAVHLANGTSLRADLVVVGIGVVPQLDLARDAGLAVGGGIAVDAGLRTSAPGIYAAGDAAEWPDPLDGTPTRVEHWVVAQRQGQAVARAIVGRGAPFRQAPFFWTIQYDFGIGYTGHAPAWDRIACAGDLAERDASFTYFSGGVPRAMAIVSRNLDGLLMEAELERRMAAIPPEPVIDTP
ncbi:FAD-dependent oxidoreductase [Robbsia sp. Bb-Pol-6]|uniref:FAD-dependent oxidoreductase n=1 Tax=Robbsia betulipollinis TaxID=2981849 RepID=A0ABT3ZN59_9BURK|nr:FAD-dependent oxidoreductase [Robbsia betulipollinis]MCY0387981.1 FAD-dependent oxidoreductase [Robbsia betulipollinis]